MHPQARVEGNAEAPLGGDRRPGDLVQLVGGGGHELLPAAAGDSAHPLLEQGHVRGRHVRTRGLFQCQYEIIRH